MTSEGPVQESFEGERTKIEGKRLRERPLTKLIGQELPVLILNTRLWI